MPGSFRTRFKPRQVARAAGPANPALCAPGRLGLRPGGSPRREPKPGKEPKQRGKAEEKGKERGKGAENAGKWKILEEIVIKWKRFKKFRYLWPCV